MRDDDLRLTLKNRPKKMQKTARTSPFVKLQRQQSRSLFSIAPEVKFFDTAVNFDCDNTLEVPATGQWALIPQGDTESTRDGRLANIRSIQFRGQLQNKDNTAVLVGALYLWVIQDKQANGAAAAVTDVFTSTTPASCLLNLNNNKRFRILKKVVYSLANEAGSGGPQTAVYAAGGNGVFPIEFFLKCNVDMDWSSTTGAITEIRSNNIFIIAGMSGAASDDNWSLVGNARLRFVG